MVNTIFLDRDGVINVDSPDYIKNPFEFHFIPGSAEALAALSCRGFDLIIISNQSVIGRKMASLEDIQGVFEKLKKGVSALNGQIRDIFYCPHKPEDYCNCRKPKPGLIFQAVEKYGIDPASSFMIGDSARDIECGRNAGCGFSLLVKTGNGEKAALELEQKKIIPDYTGTDLMACARWICNNFKSSHPVL